MQRNLEINLRHLCPSASCDYSSWDESAVHRHHRQVHQQRTLIPCPEPGCAVTAKEPAYIRLHHRRVHQKVYRVQCHVCASSLCSRSALRQHIRIRHTEHWATDYDCEVCNVLANVNMVRSRASREASARRRNPMIQVSLEESSTVMIKREPESGA